jgi:D-alanyl-lipoteichoic acid acyltransferase DltB (MBOAT superfamily)
VLFNSLQFLWFFPLVTLVYFLLPYRGRWAWLLAASCYFYMCFIPKYILILAFTISVDYCAGIALERAGTNVRRRLGLLVASIVANLGVLSYFKYSNFIVDNLNGAAHFLGWNLGLHALQVILPIGLSFHTFQAMSYTIEIYRGNFKAERHLGYFALYVMYYPQLVAGPIERPQNLIPQLRSPHDFDYRQATDGLKLMAWGMFKKVVIADRLAPIVNLVYGEPTHFFGPALVAATMLFAFQIYCDFSGYSDIAIGSAQVMGVRLMQNFDRPFLSRSVPEFWTRWHISLTSWFRDYLYFPLGGSRVSWWRHGLNVMLVFALCGLWHGASWSYAVCGAVQGVFVIATHTLRQVTRPLVERLPRWPWLYEPISIAVTFALVCFSMIFFRAQNLTDAIYIVKHLGTVWRWSGLMLLRLTPGDWWLILVALLILAAVEVARSFGPLRLRLAASPWVVRWSLYYGVIVTTLACGRYEAQPFFYFQF